MMTQKPSATQTSKPSATAKADIMKAAGDQVQEVEVTADQGDSLVQKKAQKH